MIPNGAFFAASAAAAAADEAKNHNDSSFVSAPPSVSFEDASLKENVDHRSFRRTPHPGKKKQACHHHLATNTNVMVTAEGRGSAMYAARLDDNYDGGEEEEEVNRDGISVMAPGYDDGGRTLTPHQHQLVTMQRWSATGEGTARSSTSSSFQDEVSTPTASANDPSTTLTIQKSVPINNVANAPKAAPPASGAYDDAAPEEDDFEAMEDVDMDGAGGGAETESEWETFCDVIHVTEPPSSVARQNLEQYRRAQDLRNKSQEALHEWYMSQVHGTVTGELQSSLEAVKDEFAELSAASTQMGDEVGQRMKENHVRRTLFSRHVQDSFHQLEAACRGLAASVMNQVDGVCGGVVVTDPTAASASTDDFVVAVGDELATRREVACRSESGSLVAPNDADSGGADPEDKSCKLTQEDWDALLAFEPMRENTQALMNANAILAQVETQLTAAVDTASEGMHKCVEGLEGFTGSVYNMFAEEHGTHEDTIQAEMVRNMNRRIDFEAAVRTQAEQSQNFFHHLMTNIRVAYDDDAAGGAAAAAAHGPRANSAGG